MKNLLTGIRGFEMVRLFLVFLVFAFSIAAHSSTTNSQHISTVRYDAQGGFIYFTGIEHWNDSDLCSDVLYVQVSSVVPGYKEILSIGMAAYLAGKSVQFLGNCSDDKNHFNANYIIMGD